MSRYTKATATERVPYLLGAIQPGDTVTVEPITCDTVRVHIPTEGIQFTCPADRFDMERAA